MVIIEVGGDRPIIYQLTYPLFEAFAGEEVSMVKSIYEVHPRPERPNHPDFTEPLWTLTQRCCSQKPQDRPDIQEVIKVLKELSVLIIHLNDECLIHTSSPKRRSSY